MYFLSDSTAYPAKGLSSPYDFTDDEIANRAQYILERQQQQRVVCVILPSYAKYTLTYDVLTDRYLC